MTEHFLFDLIKSEHGQQQLLLPLSRSQGNAGSSDLRLLLFGSLPEKSLKRSHTRITFLVDIILARKAQVQDILGRVSTWKPISRRIAGTQASPRRRTAMASHSLRVFIVLIGQEAGRAKGTSRTDSTLRSRRRTELSSITRRYAPEDIPGRSKRTPAYPSPDRFSIFLPRG